MIGRGIAAAVERHVEDFDSSSLGAVFRQSGNFVIKFVGSRWAADYQKPSPLKVSEKPALTWGTATYVTPLTFPLSSALYGRVGLVTEFDPRGWKVFDATHPAARAAYVRWAGAQPAFQDLVLTVHSTHSNHLLRNKFRKEFGIDCVCFRPDQEAEIHTDRGRHVWMAVTDWTPAREIDPKFSARLAKARFTVLVDEEFALEERGLPIQRAKRTLEEVTEKITSVDSVRIASARSDPALPQRIAALYQMGGYLHAYIEP